MAMYPTLEQQIAHGPTKPRSKGMPAEALASIWQVRPGKTLCTHVHFHSIHMNHKA